MSPVVAGDDRPSTQPSLTRVVWFRREPTGGTLYVRPGDADPQVALSEVADEVVAAPLP